MTKKQLHIPHRSRNIPMEVWVDYPGKIPPQWQAMAQHKGFRIDRRIRDKDHLVLECLVCEGHTAHHVYNLREAQPACAACQKSRRHSHARKVGFQLLRRDDTHRHNYHYLLPCGHVRVLQRGQVEKLQREGAKPGRLGHHCPTCHAQKEQSIAARWGWTLLGRDPEENPNYRLLAHDICGHHQRVATANMETGRFNCGKCGEGWVSAPSFLYMMRFRVPGFGHFVKLGYSRNPDSRLRYQLDLRSDVEAELIDKIEMPSGQVALRIERRLHRTLKTDYPTAVVSTTNLANWINVTSEVYIADLEPVIQQILDKLASSRRHKTK